MYYLRIRTKNKCRKQFVKAVMTPKKGVFRLGSVTENKDIFTPRELRRGIIEINTVESVKTSNNKKRCAEIWKKEKEYYNLTADFLPEFIENNNYYEVLDWFTNGNGVIIKHIHSSRGKGIYRFTKTDWVKYIEFIQSHNMDNYIVEKYYTYSREYRLHIDTFGCFHTSRKMLKSDSTDRWHRHDCNSVYIKEENELFDKPENWNDIINACQFVRQAIGLDICSVDVKVQSKNNNVNPKFIILETNSGTGLGDETIKKYKTELTKIARLKYGYGQFSYE